MNEIASRGQLRLSFVRWALLTVPLILFLGFLSGRVSNSGYGNRWFAALDKPALMPPGWLFGTAWSILYILMALALAIVIHARGARGRGLAIGLFIAQLVGNLLWSPLFFGMHQVRSALLLILVILALASVTTWLFARIRGGAGLLMLPYLLWLCFAALLNYQILERNPRAETLVVPAVRTNI